MNIILDKSYLIGVKPEVITDILSKYHLIMSDTLFMEIMTADDKSQIKKCFNKFPQKTNPVDLIPHSHHLMRLEKTNHKCTTPIEKHILKEKYRFNPCLCKDKYKIEDKNLNIFIKEWESNSSENAIGFKEKTYAVNVWFPELQDKGIISEQEKNLAIKKISEDIDFIKNVYSELQSGILKNKGEKWPAPEKINKDWAIFRYLQFHLMSSLELFYRQTQNDKEFLNTYLDMDYCILGSLADGLASRDKKIEYFYKKICPEKIFLN